MRVRLADIVSVLAMIFVAFFTVAHFPDLPARVAVHFDINGRPNGWMTREMAAWFMPLFTFGLFLVVRLVAALVPRVGRPRANDSSVALVAMLTTLLMMAVHVVVLRIALGVSTSINDSIWLLLGAFFVGLGLVMPRLRRNGFIGIRTRTTLSSDENWARTQRFAGVMMVASGLVAAVCGTAFGTIGAGIAILSITTAPLFPMLYSRRLAREE